MLSHSKKKKKKRKKGTYKALLIILSLSANAKDHFVRKSETSPFLLHVALCKSISLNLTTVEDQVDCMITFDVVINSDQRSPGEAE